jgi:hypothetical protein
MSEIKLPISGGIGTVESSINFENKDDSDVVKDDVIDKVEKLENSDEITIVEIDGVEYDLDSNGNAIKDGTIFKTKIELEELSKVIDEENEEDDSLDLNNIAKELNLEFKDDSGNPISFEPTKEGLVEFVQAVYDTGIRANELSAREQMIKNYPELEDVINYISVNGSLSGYNADSLDYLGLELDKNNQNQLISIVRKSREAKGDSESEINKFVSLVVSDGSLFEVAQSSLSYLKGIVERDNQELAKAAREKEDNDIREYQSWLNTINDTVKKGTFKLGESEVRIPVQFKITNDEGKVEVKSKEQFLDYLTTIRDFKTNDGKTIRATQYEVDKYFETYRLGYNKDIYDAMRLFTKGDLTSVINKSVESQRVDEIKKKLRYTTKSTNAAQKGGNAIVFPVKKQLQ